MKPVFKRPGWIGCFVFDIQILKTNCLAHHTRPHQRRIPLAKRYLLIRVFYRQDLCETPYAVPRLRPRLHIEISRNGFVIIGNGQGGGDPGILTGRTAVKHRP